MMESRSAILTCTPLRLLPPPSGESRMQACGYIHVFVTAKAATTFLGIFLCGIRNCTSMVGFFPGTSDDYITAGECLENLAELLKWISETTRNVMVQ